MLAANLGMGFLGGILSGFLAGYIALFVRDKVNLPQNFEGLKPVLVIPLLSTLAVGLLLVYVFGVPVKAIMDGLYIVAIAAGTLVTALAITQLKRWQPKAKEKETVNA